MHFSPRERRNSGRSQYFGTLPANLERVNGRKTRGSVLNYRRRGSPTLVQPFTYFTDTERALRNIVISINATFSISARDFEIWFIG